MPSAPLIAFLAILGVLMASCATQHPQEREAANHQLKWYHYPPLSYDEFYANVHQCDEAQRYTAGCPSRQQRVEIYNACMRSKGWILK